MENSEHITKIKMAVQLPDLSLAPLSTSIRSSPQRVRVASFCRTSAWIPAVRERVFSRFTVLFSIMAVGWLLFSINSTSVEKNVVFLIMIFCNLFPFCGEATHYYNIY